MDAQEVKTQYDAGSTALPGPSDVMALARAQAAAPPAPREILALAVQRGADPDTLEKLMALQERWEANEAKKLYTAAMAAFKQRAPAVLDKDGTVDFKTSKGRTHYTHATLGSVVGQMTKLLGEHGLSASWSTAQTDRLITVTCHITHEAGHSEQVTLAGPPDASGNKNPIQQVGSTVTYLQRYTLLAALGLATADQDDDGAAAGAGPQPANEEQMMDIRAMCAALEIHKEDWAPNALNLFPAGVRRVRDMTAAEAATLITRLTQANTKVDLAPATGPARDPLLDNAAGQAEATAATEGSEAAAQAEGQEDVTAQPPIDRGALIAELEPMVDRLNAPEEKQYFGQCGITGAWREADTAGLLALYGALTDKENA